MQAIERSGKIDKNGKLLLDAPLDVTDARVKVIVLIPETDKFPDEQWLQGIKHNKAFDFLDDPAEDIYSGSDGEAFTNET